MKSIENNHVLPFNTPLNTNLRGTMEEVNYPLQGSISVESGTVIATSNKMQIQNTFFFNTQAAQAEINGNGWDNSQSGTISCTFYMKNNR